MTRRELLNYIEYLKLRNNLYHLLPEHSQWGEPKVLYVGKYGKVIHSPYGDPILCGYDVIDKTQPGHVLWYCSNNPAASCFESWIPIYTDKFEYFWYTINFVCKVTSSFDPQVGISFVFMGIGGGS